MFFREPLHILEYFHDVYVLCWECTQELRAYRHTKFAQEVILSTDMYVVVINNTIYRCSKVDVDYCVAVVVGSIFDACRKRNGQYY